jgi:hypothetical protein
MFPQFKMHKYFQVKEDPNAITMEDEWGRRYFFRYVTEDCWSFQSINYKKKGEK